MSDLVSDLRFTARMLAKNPGFTTIAVTALALGIGANTAIFSVVNAVLLRPLPFTTADRLMSVASTSRGLPDALSYPDFRDYRTRNRSFDHMAAYHDASWSLTGNGREAVNLNMIVASADLFATLGVQPFIGRAFRMDEDDTASASPMAVVLSHAAWQKYFHGDPRVAGKSITLRAQPYTVIGVMPAGFKFPIRTDPVDAWTTFAFSEDLRTATGGKGMAEQRGAHFLDAVATLTPGSSVERANADLKVIADGLAKQYSTNRYRSIRIEPLLNSLVQNMRPVLLLLLAAVSCVLLVACANVANLLLARASSRHREIAIRTALGAGRFRVARQVLTESVALSLLGGLAGILLATWGTDLLTRFGPQDVPRLGSADIDFRVFLFALAISVITGVVFGVFPAFRASGTDPAESLKEGSRGSTEGIRSNKARSALVVGEVALALMLLACAGLLIRSLDKLRHLQPGFRSENVLSAIVALPEIRYQDPQVDRFLTELETRLSQLPGVISASDVVILPLGGNDMSTGLTIEGQVVNPAERPLSRINMISPNYLKTMGIPLLSGRDFTPHDDLQAKEVVLVNAAFVKKFFPGQNPLGKRVKPGFAHGESAPFREIVGVIGSVEQDRIGREPLPEVFYPRSQFPNSYTAIVVRTGTDPRQLIPALRSTIRTLDPDVPFQDISTMNDRVSVSLSQPRFQGFLFVIFALVALILTAVGLYGVISYSVSQRTHEIGTRMALGAREGNIFRLVVGQGVLLTSLGVVIGLAGALFFAGALKSMLYDVTPLDPLTLGSVTALVFLVAILATYIPARRAARVDPMTALRYE